mmetsp:Transcript_24602/g.34351  ORF Transcript_24602/g.34351 Transcript_24602/m.34351 type:complete len:740 (-) Transcript_24602:1345-3564(-)
MNPKFTGLALAGLLAQAAASKPAFAQRKVSAKSLRKVQRKLDEDEEISSDYSVSFNTCLHIKVNDENLYDDDFVDYVKAGKVEAVKSMVIFDVCKTDYCEYESDSNLHSVDLATWVGSLVEAPVNKKENYCEACRDSDEYCNPEEEEDEEQDEDEEDNEEDEGEDEENDEENDEEDDEEDDKDEDEDDEDDNDEEDEDRKRKLAVAKRHLEGSYVDCNTCAAQGCFDEDEENDGDDAAIQDEDVVEWIQELAECVELENDNDDDGIALYAGLTCNGDGTGVTIGVFLDEDCTLLTSVSNFRNVLSNDADISALYQESGDLMTYSFLNDVSCAEAQYKALNNDDEEEEEEAIVSDADSSDHDYSPEVKKPKKQKATKKKVKETGKKKKASEDSKEFKKKNKLFKQEQVAFEHCENKYLHHFNNIEEYIESEDTSKLETTLRRILGIVDDLTAPFIQTYNIAIIMKDKVKPFIAAKKGKKDPMYGLYKQVFSKMGSVFKEKLEKVPEGFEPKKTWKKPADESPRPSSPQETKLSEPVELNLTPVKKSNGTKAVSDDIVKSPVLSRPSSRAGQSILAATKTVRKAFSLGNLMRPKPTESQPGTSSDGRLRTTAAAAPEKKEAPSWLMKSPENYPSTHTNEDRKYAFEFYESLSAGFPDQRVDRPSLAKNLELAVFEWSQEKDRDGWVDKYWEKTHSLVAAVRGKWGTGGLIVHKILKGTYPTPRDVVLLPDDVLEWSFDGSS